MLVGAGPGDPELLTIKAMQFLQKADVVLTDRLVSAEIIKLYVGPNAEVIYVGKQCRKGNATPQATINELLVIYAQEGKLVVRLKGGDVSIFSNILDELETLVQHNIPYEIVPGVTAALGAAAYAGIPLTARNHATAVRFVTAYKSDVVSDSYWKELAQTNDTIVFYMSAETLPDVVAHLIKNKIASDKFVGSLTYIRIYSGTLKSGSYIYNPRTRKKERLGRLVLMHANKREEIDEMGAGNIVAAVGIKEAKTGDTI